MLDSKNSKHINSTAMEALFSRRTIKHILEQYLLENNKAMQQLEKILVANGGLPPSN